MDCLVSIVHISYTFNRFCREAALYKRLKDYLEKAQLTNRP